MEATAPKRFSEALICQLTADEVAERADRAARLQYDHDELAAEMASEANGYKAKLVRIEVEQRRLLDEVRTRQGYRPVECERQADFAAGVLRTVRLDTGEIVRTRQLTAEERQKQLFVDDDYPDPWDVQRLGDEDDEDDEPQDDAPEDLDLPLQPEDGPEPKETR